mgnify:CR=1 FL=1
MFYKCSIFVEASAGCACEDNLAQVPVGPVRVAAGVSSLN